MLSEAQQFVNWTRRTNPYSHTWKDYASDLKRFIEVVGDKDLEQVSVHNIDAFILRQAEQGFKPKTINRRLSMIRSLYGYSLNDN